MVVNRMKVNELKKELKGLSTAELVEKENELKQELFNLRFQLATGQLEGTARIREVRKQIARIKTALRQEELQKIIISKGGNEHDCRT